MGESRLQAPESRLEAPKKALFVENIRCWWRAIGEGEKKENPEGVFFITHEQGQLEQRLLKQKDAQQHLSQKTLYF